MRWRRVNRLLAKKIFHFASENQVTFGPVQNTTPVWSPDGKWIAYAARLSSQTWAIVSASVRPTSFVQTDNVLLTTAIGFPRRTPVSRLGQGAFWPGLGSVVVECRLATGAPR
jgi:hypothetical protein